MNKEQDFTTEPGKVEWSDKRHHFGRPWSFTHYSLSDGRLYVKRGLLCTFHDEVMLFRICDVRMVQTLWQRLFKVGTVVVYAADMSTGRKSISLMSIKEPLKVRDFISRKVDAEREARGIQSAEFLGGGF